MDYTKGECGCTVTILRFDNIEHPVKWRINYCPLHKSALNLYEALLVVYKDIELQNVAGGSDELNQIVGKALAKVEEK